MRLDHLLSKSKSRVCHAVLISRVSHLESRALSVARHARNRLIKTTLRKAGFSRVLPIKGPDLLVSRKFRWRCVRGKHPFPSRTRRLRPRRPMVLCWRRHGRVGGCRILFKENLEMPVISVTRGCSSVGRAPALQAGGHEFESHHLH